MSHEYLLDPALTYLLNSSLCHLLFHYLATVANFYFLNLYFFPYHVFTVAVSSVWGPGLGALTWPGPRPGSGR